MLLNIGQTYLSSKGLHKENYGKGFCAYQIFFSKKFHDIWEYKPYHLSLLFFTLSKDTMILIRFTFVKHSSLKKRNSFQDYYDIMIGLILRKLLSFVNGACCVSL